MGMRKSKYDTFIAYDEKKNQLIQMQWDTSYNGVSNWFHYDGKKCYYVRENGYLAKFQKQFKVIDRIPEGQF
jgi:hypothetical protein